MKRLHVQMTTLNRAARDCMLRYEVHSCTDVTGFSLMGHAYEMASGSGCTIHLCADRVPYHPEAWELADMGFCPAWADLASIWSKKQWMTCSMPMKTEKIF